MDNFTKKCIHDHRNPIVKLSLPAQKLFLSAKTEEDKKLINEHQEQFRIILDHQRIEKRLGRAQAVWLPDENIAKVTKLVKNLVKYFGFQNKYGVFLYPEEMLFLLETNRLEVTFNGNGFSIERGYELVLKTTNISLSRYRIYKKLSLLGYKLVRFEQIDNKILNKIKKNNMKRALEEGPVELQPTKRTKEDIPCHKMKNISSGICQSGADQKVSQTQTENFMGKEAAYVYDILERIKQIMPRDIGNAINCLKPDYCIFSPSNVVKLEPDFNLYICEDNIPDKRNFHWKVPSIYASCIDDVAFYRFNDVHLPNM